MQCHCHKRSQTLVCVSVCLSACVCDVHQACQVKAVDSRQTFYILSLVQYGSNIINIYNIEIYSILYIYIAQ